MNVLIMTAYYPAPDHPGVKPNTKAIFYFAREWVKQGHQVTVLHCCPHTFREMLSYRPWTYGRRVTESSHEGVRVVFVEDQFFYRNCQHFTAGQQRRIAAAINAHFRAHSPDYRPDCMVVHFPSHFEGIVENLSFSCPKFAVLHNVDRHNMLSEKDVPDFAGHYGIYKAFGARSAYIRDSVEAIGMPVPFLVNSGIDTAWMMDEAALRTKWDGMDDCLRVAYAGSFLERKHVETIITALGRLKGRVNFHLTVIGDGKRRPLLEKLAEETGIARQCTFTGQLPREEVVRQLKKAQVFAMVSRAETLGLVYLEAMSQGCVVIGSEKEGIDGVVTHGENGYLLPAGDAEALARQLERIAQMDRSQKQAVARRGLETVRGLSSEQTAAEYISNLAMRI